MLTVAFYIASAACVERIAFQNARIIMMFRSLRDYIVSHSHALSALGARTFQA